MAFKRSDNRGKNAASRGFTLIELAITLIIVGLIVAPIFAFMTTYLEKKKIEDMEDMNERIKEIRLALTRYVQDDPNDATDEVRYPCPAPLTAAKGSSNYGMELCPTGSVSAGQDLGGVFVAQGTDAGKFVLIGTVPTKTLQIPDDLMQDEFGNRMTYAVTVDLTQTDALLADPHPPGQITINHVDDSGAVFASTTDAEFLIISHGEDGAGAYTYNGGQLGRACRSTASGNAVNCSWQNTNSAVFQDNGAYGFSTANNDEYYDDYTLYTLGDHEGWWAAIDSSGADIASRATGNTLVPNGRFGIGTNAPAEKLHVMGNSRIEGSETVTGGSIIGGDLTVNGNSLINGNSRTVGNNRAGSSAVDGSQTVGVDLSVGRNFGVGGSSTINGNSTVGGNNTIGGTQHVQQNLVVSGNTGIGTSTPQAKLEVNGYALLGAATANTGCSPPGLMGRDPEHGLVLTCQDGLWKPQNEATEELGAIVGCKEENDFCAQPTHGGSVLPGVTVYDSAGGGKAWKKEIGPRTFCALGFVAIIPTEHTVFGAHGDFCRVKPGGIDAVTNKPVWYIHVGSVGSSVACHAVCMK